MLYFDTEGVVYPSPYYADEKFVESKLLEQLRSSVASWCSGDESLLECSGMDRCGSAEHGGGSGHLKGGVALASDLTLKRLGGLLRPMFFIARSSLTGLVAIAAR